LSLAKAQAVTSAHWFCDSIVNYSLVLALVFFIVLYFTNGAVFLVFVTMCLLV